MKIDKYVLCFAILLQIVLGILFINHLSNGSEAWIDTILSTIGLWIFVVFMKHFNQDRWSFGCFLVALFVHNMGWYGTLPLGIRFDHYMHFLGGFTIAIVADRLFFEKMGYIKRGFLIVFFALGVGSLGEIIEWVGYGMKWHGDGFLFYGIGDDGEYRNAALDMVFNLFGALGYVFIRKLGPWRK